MTSAAGCGSAPAVSPPASPSAFSSASPSAEQPTGDLVGTVTTRSVCATDAGNGPCPAKPVAMAEISVRSTAAPASVVRTVLSRSDGRFLLRLAPGRYRVSASRSAQRPAHVEIEVGAGQTTTVSLTLGVLNRHPMRPTSG